MCGICGIVRFDDGAIAPEPLHRGCDALRHRGPDHTGVWIGEATPPHVAFGVVRLSVLDPSPACHQPLHDRTGRCHLAFNGELYNFRALRDELLSAGASFKTDGDTEVVLAACAYWGDQALRRFDGIGAIAFYDSHERIGFLARDRFGVKPLLYRFDSGGLSFASEMRGLRAMANFDKSVDAEAIVHLLTFGYVADPATVYANVRRLPPGHVLRFGPRGAKPVEPWFTPDASQEPTGARHDYVEACATVRRLIGDAVVRQRIADVPIGAFLSGGLDSSIIVHHLAEAASRPVQTFSVGYAGAATYDESTFARLVAERYGTQHHAIKITDRDAIDAIPCVLDHLGEPVGDSSIIPTSLVSEFAARDLTVALSGDGGDELFGGYWRYLGHEAFRTYECIPLVLRRGLIEPMLRRLGSSKTSRLRNRARQLRKLVRARSGDAIDRHVDWCAILSPEARAMFRDETLARRCVEGVQADAHRRTESRDADDPLNRILAFDLEYQLPSDMLQKVDLAGMMHSLEVRVPFLDPALVDYVQRLPSHFKVRQGVRKRLLIDAYRGRLADAVLDRSKQGFEVPIGEYLRGPLMAMFLDVVRPDVIDSFGGLLSPVGIRSVFDDHLSARGEHADVLFALLSLCWWRRSGG